MVNVSAAGIIVGYGAQPITERQLVRWSIRFDALIDDTSRVWITARLRRARTIRCASFAIGLLVAGLPMFANVIDARRAASFSNPAVANAPFIAVALGALIAELFVVQRPRGERAATLTRRQVDDYLDRMWPVVIGVTAPIAAIAALLANALHVWQARWAWLGAGCALCALLAVTVGLRNIIDRPALAVDGDQRLLDDALRADGAHHLAGACVLLAVTGAGQALLILGGSSAWTWLVALAMLAAIGCWSGIARKQTWNVARARRAHA